MCSQGPGDMAATMPVELVPQRGSGQARGLFCGRAIAPWPGWALGMCQTSKRCHRAGSPCGIDPLGTVPSLVSLPAPLVAMGRRCLAWYWWAAPGAGAEGGRRGARGEQGGQPRGCELQSQQCPAFPRRGCTCLSSASSAAGMWRETPSYGDRQRGGRQGRGTLPTPSPCLAWGSVGLRLNEVLLFS